MIYQLLGIAERKVSIQIPAEELPQQDYVIDWQFLPKFRFIDPETLEVSITTTIQQTQDAAPPLLFMDTAHFFKLDSDATLSTHSFPTELSKQQEMLLATLLGISLGTIRGLAYARTVGILGTDVFMPVVSPIDMIRTSFSRRRQANADKN